MKFYSIPAATASWLYALTWKAALTNKPRCFISTSTFHWHENVGFCWGDSDLTLEAPVYMDESLTEETVHAINYLILYTLEICLGLPHDRR